MKPIIAVENIASSLVTTLWTPIFVAIFIAIVTYALWPRNKAAFDEAASMPLEKRALRRNAARVTPSIPVRK
jgi:cytochrome c oxidase cbb3-type subunit 4